LAGLTNPTGLAINPFGYTELKPVFLDMRIPYFQINAFTASTFGGNPAGVCFLDRWLDDQWMLAVATENGFAETAFVVPEGDHFLLRWMTPTVEVDLCGHATLAAAHALLAERGYGGDMLRFHTRSGWLAATRRGDLIELDFPARPPAVCPAPEGLVAGLGHRPAEVLKSRDYLAVYETPEEVAALVPNMDLLARLDCLGVIATARGRREDFVSRFFAPGAGVPEDPVTGSAHCTLIPYWAGRLGKQELFARQISQRGGELSCCLRGERVGIGGKCVVYCRGELEVDGLTT
jgi:predicted PhzF superfamily epimerase YddE/YHI9